MTKSKIRYEPEDDVLNIWFSKKPIDYAEEMGNVIMHFTKNNEPVYLEILEATKFISAINRSLPQDLKSQVLQEVYQAT